jgi:hypothetical protein
VHINPTCKRVVIAAVSLTVMVTVTVVRAQQATNFPPYPRRDISVTYRVDPSFPQKPTDITWQAMAGVTVDAKDQIWAFNRGAVPIQVYTADGAFVRGWGQGLFKNAHQLRFDNEGNLWAVDNGFNTVTKWAPDGALLMTLGTKDAQGEDATHFNQPTDIAIAPNGDLFVADGYVNSRIVHFDKRGKFIRAWGKLGTGPGEFSLVHGIAIDSKGRLYALDRNNSRVQVFDRSGKYLTEWRNIVAPWAVWITPKDEIYICGSTTASWAESGKGPMSGAPPKDQVVVKFDTDGRVKALWGFPPGNDKVGQLGWAHGIALDSKGNLYLGGIQDKKVQKFVRVEPSA